MKQAFQTGTPATAPAPITPSPDAANVAVILLKIFFILRIIPPITYNL